MDIQEIEEGVGSLPSSLLAVAVAVNGSKNSKYALKWALDKFIPEGRILFRLLHVRPKITMVPTPMGNYLPISKVRDDVASAYRKEIEWKTNSMLLPYKKMCNQRQVEAEAVVIEADDVADAISSEVDKFAISKLVIGGASGNVFTRKFKGCKTSSKISEHVPSFCMVYVVSKGKLSSVRSSTSVSGESTRGDSNSSIASHSISSHSSSEKSGLTDADTTSNFSLPRTPSLSSQRDQALRIINQNFINMRSNHSHTLHDRSISLCTDEDFMSSISNISDVQFDNISTISSYRSLLAETSSQNFNHGSTSDNARDSSLLANEMNVDFELEKLRIELRHLQGMYEIAQNEAHDASRQLNELSTRRMEEGDRLQEIKIREDKAREMAKQERERREEAEREAEFVRECAEREVFQRSHAENTAFREDTEKQRLERVLACSDKQYMKYTWEEIESATSSFADDLKLGIGANGTVYKASFHHTTAAVKILHSEGHGTKQFNQELEVLGRIRHPHLLLLLGACPEKGCLVYEYMENGSLEDRLSCRNSTPPLPWYYRYRIAWEVASALVFLHNSKPDPIIHRDLKPANILLDDNFVSKIGDVGLSTLLPTKNFSLSTMYRDTAPVGTFFYIDPEYQRTGHVSAKSDTYALGMVILQLVTGKPPMGLTHIVETALEDQCLVDVLDSKAGEWPKEETQELALLGLSCTELRRKDRPDLKAKVLPVLERLKGIAEEAHDLAHHAPSLPPNHFICPILQEVMDDPYVASDGYTYDRKAIETWFGMKDKSPMTNLKMPNKDLIPNHSLRSAISDWKSRTQ